MSHKSQTDTNIKLHGASKRTIRHLHYITPSSYLIVHYVVDSNWKITEKSFHWSNMTSLLFAYYKHINMNVLHICYFSPRLGPVLSCWQNRHSVASLVKNPHTNTGDTGSISDPGRSHVPQSNQARSTTIEPGLWSPGAATTEPSCHNFWNPQALEPTLCNQRGHRDKKPAHCN